MTSHSSRADRGRSPNAKFKVILLGDQGVGKTSFFLRVKDDIFMNPRHVTIGLDMYPTRLKINGVEVEILLCDTAGSERYRTLTRNYYRNSKAVLFMFSMDDPSSLYRLVRWEEDAKEYAPSALRYLVGNKSDLYRAIPDETIASFALAHDCEGAFINSARTGEGVGSILPEVAGRLLGDTQREAELGGSWLEETVNVYRGEEIPGHHPPNSSSCC